MGGGHDEREQTLNQLLVEMDGFDIETDVVPCACIFATRITNADNECIEGSASPLGPLIATEQRHKN